ncbi:PQQ-binding-like beta-propeller repeat protein [Pyrodictium occultum]|uniref:outer membrane protein assembly factor BamB family protein n=1 Tax=Pyrodictium occultum TaxID=2309 RepID=UPI0009F81B59|nr:PQQ-binding-like beta-propeller repeat protein [Pyrodictium occultum]
MSRTWLITVVAVLIAAGLVAGYEVLSHPSTASKTVATTVARTTVATPAATLVKTVATTRTVTVPVTRTVVIEEARRPRLLADIPIASRSSLPPYTYVQVSSWRSHAPYTLIVFAPSSDEFAVTVTRFVGGKPVSEVRVFSVEGGKVAELWRFSVGSGYVRSLAWSSDGAILFIGEDSIDGRVVAVNASTGRMLWSYATSRDLGKGDPREPRWYWPQVHAIRYRGGRVYVAAAAKPQASYGKNSVIYCFDAKTGQLLWRYPPEGFIDTLVSDIELSPDGSYLAAATWYYRGKAWKGGDLLLLDAATGKLLARFRPSPRPPFRWCGSWNGLGWLDNTTIAYVTDVGIIHILQAPNLTEKAEINVTNPLPVLVIPKGSNTTEEGYAYAFSGYSKVLRTPNGRTLLLVRTSNTYGVTALGKNARPTLNHPDANSLFIYEWVGGKLVLVAKYPLHGRPNYEQWATYSPAKGLLAVPVGHDYISRTMVYTGVYVLNLTDIEAVRSGEALTYMVKPPRDAGVVIGGAISPDGSKVVAVTYPINLGTLENPRFVGSYRILVYSLG